MKGYWEELERPGPDTVRVAGLELRKGSRVVLHPRAGGDIFDIALAGRTAIIEGIDQDLDGEVKLAVVVDEDPGADLGMARQPGHRFFFSLEEVEPAAESTIAAEPVTRGPKILVAGIGNVFLGDDGFGVALAGRLARSELPANVTVVDYGIRGMDLAYAMPDYDVVIMLDASPRGDAPGTLYLIEPALEEHQDVSVDAHGMDPVNVLAMLRALGGRTPRTLVVGCEPATQITLDDDDLVADLSEPVRLALDGAVGLVESVLSELQPNADKELSEQ